MDRQHVTGPEIIRGNALDLPIADASVDLVVTSPPYFGLRSYQDGGEHYDGQIGGTGTTALVASALGRRGISVDMSADYCRLAEWRTTDPQQRAKAARRPFTPAAEQVDGQASLLDLLGGESA